MKGRRDGAREGRRVCVVGGIGGGEGGAHTKEKVMGGVCAPLEQRNKTFAHSSKCTSRAGFLKKI